MLDGAWRNATSMIEVRGPASTMRCPRSRRSNFMGGGSCNARLPIEPAPSLARINAIVSVVDENPYPVQPLLGAHVRHPVLCALDAMTMQRVLYSSLGASSILCSTSAFSAHSRSQSLIDLRDAVNRTRYGIGQLADYQVRYRAELQGAKPLLALGRPPDRQTSWIATILQENGIGLLSGVANRLEPLNDLARESPIFL